MPVAMWILICGGVFLLGFMTAVFIERYTGHGKTDKKKDAMPDHDTYPFGLCATTGCINEPAPGQIVCESHLWFQGRVRNQFEYRLGVIRAQEEWYANHSVCPKCRKADMNITCIGFFVDMTDGFKGDDVNTAKCNTKKCGWMGKVNLCLPPSETVKP